MRLSLIMNDACVYSPDRYSINVNVFIFVRCVGAFVRRIFSAKMFYVTKIVWSQLIKSRYYLILTESNIDKTHTQFEARLAIDFCKIKNIDLDARGQRRWRVSIWSSWNRWKFFLLFIRLLVSRACVCKFVWDCKVEGKKGESVKLREEEMQTEFVASRKEGMSERGSFARSFNPKMHCAFDVYLRYDRYRLYRI